jgi:mono/diheme cytochrome c family protein
MRSTITAAFVALTLAGAPAVARADAPDPKIQRKWKAKCASCHGEDGKGQTEQAKKMGGIRDVSTEAWQKEWTDAKIRAAIEKGVKEEKDGKKKEMEAYQGKLTDPEIDGLVKFMRGLKK